MGQPAARAGDMHTCPMSTGMVSHVGGPVAPPCCPTVLIGGSPAARISDLAVCVGPIDVIAQGSSTVLIGGLPAARVGDPTIHGGVIAAGCGTVLIGDMSGVGSGAEAKVGAGPPSQAPGLTPEEADKAIKKALADQKALLEHRKAALTRWNDADKKTFKKWFGKDDGATRKTMQDRIDRMLELNKSMAPANFKAAPKSGPGLFAQVYPDDPKHQVELGPAFAKAPESGKDSKAGTLAHEMSHFDDIGGTDDHVYGTSGAEKLAAKNPDKAVNNADNFEYYLEDTP